MNRRLAVFFCLLPGAVAAAGLTDGEWTRHVAATALTRFVRHGIERADESLQPAVWLQGESLKFGTWMNIPLDGARGRELALVAACRFRAESGTELDLEATHSHLRDARNGHPGRTAELAATFARPLGPGRAVIRYTRDVQRQADTAEAGYEGEWALQSFGAFLRYRAYVGSKSGRDILPGLPGAKVADSYRFHGFDLTLPYRVGGATVLTAGVHYAGTQGQRRLWSPRAARAGAKLWATLAATCEF